MPRDLPAQDERGLARFLNALRILRSIDREEFVHGGVRGSEWASFTYSPTIWLMNASDEDAARVWALVEARQPGAAVVRPAVPEPPWPIGADHNAKRAGWEAFFAGKPREPCPFPSARRDLLLGYRQGWDEASGAPIYVRQCGDEMTEGEARRWYDGLADELIAAGVTWVRYSVHEHIANLRIVEGWRVRPHDEGEVRWALTAEPTK